MIKKLYLEFGGGCYTARVSNEGVKTFDCKILLCKSKFYYDADHPNFTMFYNSLLICVTCPVTVITKTPSPQLSIGLVDPSLTPKMEM
jgi:hypothetical protein